jgi:hypothetical protein
MAPVVDNEESMSDQQATGMSDPTYKVISVVYRALQGGGGPVAGGQTGGSGCSPLRDGSP